MREREVHASPADRRRRRRSRRSTGSSGGARAPPAPRRLRFAAGGRAPAGPGPPRPAASCRRDAHGGETEPLPACLIFHFYLLVDLAQSAPSEVVHLPGLPLDDEVRDRPACGSAPIGVIGVVCECGFVKIFKKVAKFLSRKQIRETTGGADRRRHVPDAVRELGQRVVVHHHLTDEGPTTASR